MTDEQPEPFFLRVWLKALAVASGDAIAFKPKQDYAAALTLQRAFAEREAELVGENAKLRRELRIIKGPTTDEVETFQQAFERGFTLPGDPPEWDEMLEKATAFLKSSEDGHG